MDGIDRHHAALAEARERRDHDIATGGEGDRAVERERRAVALGSDPIGAQRLGQFAVRSSAACRHRDVASPGAEHGKRQVRRRAEAEQPHTFAALDAGDAQAAESDDPGAQQRRGFQILSPAGRGIAKSARATANSA